MATPTEIAEASACFRCISDQKAAELYLLATIAGVTIDQIIAGSACYRCLADPNAALLYLLDVISANTAAAAGNGQILCGAGAPVAAPTTTCAIYYDTSNDALYIWRGGAWQLKV